MGGSVRCLPCPVSRLPGQLQKRGLQLPVGSQTLDQPTSRAPKQPVCLILCQGNRKPRGQPVSNDCLSTGIKLVISPVHLPFQLFPSILSSIHLPSTTLPPRRPATLRPIFLHFISNPRPHHPVVRSHHGAHLGCSEALHQRHGPPKGSSDP